MPSFSLLDSRDFTRFRLKKLIVFVMHSSKCHDVYFLGFQHLRLLCQHSNLKVKSFKAVVRNVSRAHHRRKFHFMGVIERIKSD